MGLCLVLEPSISSSAKKRNSKGSSLNSLFSNTEGGEDTAMNVNLSLHYNQISRNWGIDVQTSVFTGFNSLAADHVLV